MRDSVVFLMSLHLAATLYVTVEKLPEELSTPFQLAVCFLYLSLILKPVPLSHVCLSVITWL